MEAQVLAIALGLAMRLLGPALVLIIVGDWTRRRRPARIG